MVPTTTLPSFNDVIASIPIRRTHSMSSMKNGNTRNLIETRSVFFINFIACCFASLTSILLAAIFSLFFLAKPSYPSIYHRPIIKNVCETLCLFLLSSILLPNRQLPTETPTLGAHILLLIQDFTASHIRLLRMGLSITEEIPRLLYLCCPDAEKIDQFLKNVFARCQWWKRSKSTVRDREGRYEGKVIQQRWAVAYGWCGQHSHCNVNGQKKKYVSVVNCEIALELV